jgi:PAS domain S-box-containing protein
MGLQNILGEAILSTGSDAIIAADQDGTIVFWNPGAQRLFGHTFEEALGQPLDLIIPEWLRGRHWGGFRRVMESGNSRYGADDLLSVPALRKDGASISVEFTIVPLRSDGRMIGMAAIMRDVTKRFDEMRMLKRKLAELTKPAE